jgi:[acyl-carrier-protein] S-malonyltransferase
MTDWAKTAFVFPGQGSQVVGMGKDIAEMYPEAGAVFQRADELLGFSLSNLCFNGPEDQLNDTINTQPAIYVYGIAVWQVLQRQVPSAYPSFTAGHSFGELTALTIADAVTFEDGLRLVRERGRVMKLAGEKSPGAMAALLGLEVDAVRDLCKRAAEQTGGILVLANDNCPGQIVISGDNSTLEVGLNLAKEAGAKRAVKLAVSIAAHSPLMESASDTFKQALANTDFKSPKVPVYANVSAKPLTSVDDIRQELNMQLTSPVRWTESVQAMIAAGAELFVELGPGDVLCGLLKRIDRSRTGIALNNAASLQQFIQNHA